jgi:hypothetical protein
MVTSIGGSGSTSGTSAQDQMKQTREDVLAAVAQELGESEADLQKGLQSGKSLTDLAAAKGVSKDDLQATIAGVIKKDMPNASATQVANIATRMMNGPHGHHGHHHAQAASTTDTSTSDTNTSDPASPDYVAGSTVSVVA